MNTAKTPPFYIEDGIDVDDFTPEISLPGSEERGNEGEPHAQAPGSENHAGFSG